MNVTLDKAFFNLKFFVGCLVKWQVNLKERGRQRDINCWKGLKAAGRAENELAEIEVGEGGTCTVWLGFGVSPPLSFSLLSLLPLALLPLALLPISTRELVHRLFGTNI